MHKDTISRREFGFVAAASVGLMTSGQSAAANERSGEPVNYSRGLIESPPTYYEALEPAGGAKKPPMVLISGGAHTGACCRHRCQKCLGPPTVVEAAGMAPPQPIFITADRRGALSHGRSTHAAQVWHIVPARIESTEVETNDTFLSTRFDGKF